MDAVICDVLRCLSPLFALVMCECRVSRVWPGSGPDRIGSDRPARLTLSAQVIYIRVDGTCVLSLFRDNFGPCQSVSGCCCANESQWREREKVREMRGERALGETAHPDGRGWQRSNSPHTFKLSSLVSLRPSRNHQPSGAAALRFHMGPTQANLAVAAVCVGRNCQERCWFT